MVPRIENDHLLQLAIEGEPSACCPYRRKHWIIAP